MSDDALISLARPYTMTGRVRMQGMIDMLRQIEAQAVPGDVVECGVWRGGNIILARMVAPTRLCWLYDTFTGMTKPEAIDTKHDGHPAAIRYEMLRSAGEGWCRAGVPEVRAGLVATGCYDPDRLRFVEGDVTKTLRGPDAALPERIALLRLDTDWYASTAAELEVLYPRLVPGGVLIIDDYGHWRGAKRAVDEYFHGDYITAGFKRVDEAAIVLVKPC